MIRKFVIIPSVLLVLSFGAIAKADLFEMSGSGPILDPIPLVEGGQARHEATGTASFLGNYSGAGIARLDTFTSATTATFSSAVPFVFESDATGDQLVVDYAGEVTLVDLGNGVFDTTWVATFTPVIGASTGIFADLIGGSFVVTAETDNFSPGEAPVNYTWSGSGNLLFVPEPTTIGIMLVGFVGLAVRRKR